MKTLAIIGAGGHGRAVADAAIHTRRWECIEFYDDRMAVGFRIDGNPVRGTVRDLAAQSFALECETDLFVAIGDNSRRFELVEKLLSAGRTLATIVHPSAVIGSNVSIGVGTVLMAGAVVNVGSQIGVGCIVNTQAGIDHDCSIGDGVHICPGVSLAGNVRVGELAWVGIGACVVQNIIIGARSTVGAGSVIIQNVEDGVTVAGNPARKLRRE